MATVLLIDDEETVRDALEAVLTRAGYVVSCAASGWEGVELLRSQKPDLVITDLFMPEMPGISLIEKIHRWDPDLPILVISGGVRSGQQTFLEDALNSGASVVMSKPFGSAEFLDIVLPLIEQDE